MYEAWFFPNDQGHIVTTQGIGICLDSNSKHQTTSSSEPKLANEKKEERSTEFISGVKMIRRQELYVTGVYASNQSRMRLHCRADPPPDPGMKGEKTWRKEKVIED